ncbi:MAG: hypothetical protein JW894_12605 [Bacteroidales bacterium]|nr:hypothetical protein [Bacteroidales bacterium]
MKTLHFCFFTLSLSLIALVCCDKKDDDNNIVNATYSTGDLDETWNLAGLCTGDSPHQTPGWYYSQITFSSDGNFVFNDPVTDSEGSNSFTPTVSSPMEISADGIIGHVDLLNFHGALSSSKDVMIAHFTGAIGNTNSVSGYNLIIFLKKDDFYTIADLNGTWEGISLVCGDSPEQYAGWSYGQMRISDGILSFTTPEYNSEGHISDITWTATLNINNEGVVTFEEDNSIRAILNKTKNMLIFTFTSSEEPGGDSHGVAGHTLIVSTKTEGQYSQHDLTGSWENIIISSGDSPSQTPGWSHCNYTIDSEGYLTFNSPVKDNEGCSVTPTQEDPLVISSDGIVTYNTEPADAYGVINLSKDIVVFKGTGGLSINCVYGYSLQFSMKR